MGTPHAEHGAPRLPGACAQRKKATGPWEGRRKRRSLSMARRYPACRCTCDFSHGPHHPFCACCEVQGERHILSPHTVANLFLRPGTGTKGAGAAGEAPAMSTGAISEPETGKLAALGASACEPKYPSPSAIFAGAIRLLGNTDLAEQNGPAPLAHPPWAADHTEDRRPIRAALAHPHMRLRCPRAMLSRTPHGRCLPAPHPLPRRRAAGRRGRIAAAAAAAVHQGGGMGVAAGVEQALRPSRGLFARRRRGQPGRHGGCGAPVPRADDEQHVPQARRNGQDRRRRCLPPRSPWQSASAGKGCARVLPPRRLVSSPPLLHPLNRNLSRTLKLSRQKLFTAAFPLRIPSL
jgi:hypothetical protein